MKNSHKNRSPKWKFPIWGWILFQLLAICKELKQTRGGLRSKYLDDLVKAGFIQRDFSWYLQDGKETKISRFRLSDNYLRFYLKYISRNRSKIQKGDFTLSVLTNFPGLGEHHGIAV